MLARPDLSYASGTSAVPLLGRTVGDDFERSVATYGDREALVDLPTHRRWTYSELDVDVDIVARGLMDLGVDKGDRVGIWAPNCAEWVLVHYATAKIGAVLVPLDPACRAETLARALAESGARLLVAAAALETSDPVAVVEQVRGGCPALGRAVFLGADSWHDLHERGERYDNMRLRERLATLGFDDPTTIRYPSDPAGRPRGATLSHHTVLNAGFFVGELLGYTERDRVCVPVPFSDGFGMVMGTLAATSHGACVVIPAPAFDPAATLQAVQDERCTSLYGDPAMFAAELALADFASYDLTRLRTGIMAGPPCPVEVMKRVVAEMHMAEVTVCNGATGTSPVPTMTRRDDDLERRVSTVGRVMPYVEVKVVDPATGRVVERGRPGELCTRGYLVMLGYRDEGRRVEAVDAARWMHTGDLATMDPGGYVTLVGRITA